MSGGVGLAVFSEPWHSGAPGVSAHHGDVASQVSSAGVT